MTAGRTEGLTKTFTAGGTINDARILKFSSADNLVVQATAATDALIGISKVPQGQQQRAIQTGPTPPTIPTVTIAANQRVDVVLEGIGEVIFGGTITRGALITADANGKAVAAAPAAGTNNRIIGVAMCSGVDGDIGTVLISPSVMQG